MTPTQAPSTNAAPYALEPGHGRADWHLGSLFEWKARGEQSDGRFALVEVTVQPGAEPPLHVHTREDEVYLILNGQFTFQVGDERFDAEPGSYIYLPRWIPHGFAVRSGVARAAVLMTPAGLEELFDRWSEPASERTLPPLPSAPPDGEALARDLAAFGVEVVGPPLPALL